jgi:hypothetical protein
MRDAAKPPISAWRTRAGSAPALEAKTSASPTASIVRATMIWLRPWSSGHRHCRRQGDVLTHEREDRLDLLERALRAADHDREACRLRADLATGNRRVEIFAAKLVDLLGELLGRDGEIELMSTTILLLSTSPPDASGQTEPSPRRAYRNHGDDDLNLLTDFLPLAQARALIDQFLRRSATGVHEQLVAAFHEVAGHRTPHDTETDETDLCHVLRLQRG